MIRSVTFYPLNAPSSSASDSLSYSSTVFKRLRGVPKNSIFPSPLSTARLRASRSITCTDTSFFRTDLQTMPACTVAVGLAVAAGFLAASVRAQSQPLPWMAVGGDAAHRSRAPAAATGYPMAGARAEWTWRPNWPSGEVISTVIASADTAFFVLDRPSTSVPASLVAVAMNGTMRWRADVPFPASASFFYASHPALSEDGLTVYVAASNLFLAYDAASGALLWNMTVNAPASAPVISGGLAILGAESSDVVTAINTAQRAVAWSRAYRTSVGYMYGAPAIATVGGAPVVALALNGGVLSGYARDSGAVLPGITGLGIKVSAGYARSAALVGNDGRTVYGSFDSAGSGVGIAGVDLATGAIVMNATIPGGVKVGRGSLAMAPSGTIVSYINEGTSVAAFSNSSSGGSGLLWTYAVPTPSTAFTTTIRSSPAIAADGSVFIREQRDNSNANTLTLLDGQTGVARWSFPLPGPGVRNSPAFAHGGLYVAAGSSPATLYKLVDGPAATPVPGPSVPPAATPSIAPSATPSGSGGGIVTPAASGTGSRSYVASVTLPLRLIGLSGILVGSSAAIQTSLYVRVRHNAAAAAAAHATRVHGGAAALLPASPTLPA